MLDLAHINRKKLETLIEINTLINSNYEDIRGLLTRIIESATRLTEGEASSLILVNPEDNLLYFEIALGEKGADVKRFALKSGEGIAGWVYEKNRSLIVNDVESDNRFSPEISEKVKYPAKSMLAVPMRLKERCVGVIEILNKRESRNFTDEDLQWLEIFATQAAIAIENARSFQKVKEEFSSLHEQMQFEKGYHVFIGESKVIKEKLEIAKKAAATDSSVLLLGESGTGKELFAEQIHLNSTRREMPFIRVNCPSLSESLLESELFGHVKGAYTDAISDRKGRFELADGGTIFLDEIGDLPLSVQAKLLRVLQQKTVEPVGSSSTINVDVRIIAATNKNIEQEVKEGRFRTDLFYRLNVLPVYIPPLRERPGDIPLLAAYFLEEFSKETKKQIDGFTEEAMETLLSYSWPGNVRELQNAVERAVVVSRGNYITPEALILKSISEPEEDRYKNRNLKDAINIFKAYYVKKTLDRNGWNQTKAAMEMGIQRTYLSRLLKELSIQKD
ncbi:MAG: sigma 54-interacting transcriptional regulator [Spirochaetales bacterium]|nr:sigma 54-interacting transcriptional regulator [Spirochaetales bacterium]